MTLGSLVAFSLISFCIIAILFLKIKFSTYIRHTKTKETPDNTFDILKNMNVETQIELGRGIISIFLDVLILYIALAHSKKK